MTDLVALILDLVKSREYNAFLFLLFSFFVLPQNGTLSALEARLKHISLYTLPHSSLFSLMPYGACVQHPASSCVTYYLFQGQDWRSMLNPVSILQIRL